jgi:hypothetical protein
MSDHKFPELRPGLAVVGADGVSVGIVREIFQDAGVVETFGGVGIPPTEGSQDGGQDPALNLYTEGAPDAGDAYCTVDSDNDATLYIPFSGIHGVEGDRLVLAVDKADIEAMGWDVRLDVLAGRKDEYPRDGGAESQVA